MQSLEAFKALALPNIDYTELTNKVYRVKDLLIVSVYFIFARATLANQLTKNNMFQLLNQKRARWEELFENQESLWTEFQMKTKLLEEWIMKAQKIVCEKNTSSEIWPYRPLAVLAWSRGA